MTFARKIVLHCPRGYRSDLDALVERFMAEGVSFVGVVGEDCEHIEDIIDELIVGDGSDLRPVILTTSHPGESIESALEFARSLSGEHGEAEAQVVEL